MAQESRDVSHPIYGPIIPVITIEGAFLKPMTDPSGAAIYGVPWIPSKYPQ